MFSTNPVNILVEKYGIYVFNKLIFLQFWDVAHDLVTCFFGLIGLDSL